MASAFSSRSSSASGHGDGAEGDCAGMSVRLARVGSRLLKSVRHGVGLSDSEQLLCLKLLLCEESQLAPGLAARNSRWGGAAYRRRDLARPGMLSECGLYVSVSI